MTPAVALALLQAAWDSIEDWTGGLPPIAFTEAEAAHLVGAIAAGIADAGDPALIAAGLGRTFDHAANLVDDPDAAKCVKGVA